MTNAGIEYYEKNVVNQLLEFMHYYTTEVLQEAKIFKEYAALSNNLTDHKKAELGVNDVKLAIASKAYQTFTRPLPLSILKQIAVEKNQMELPRFDEGPPGGSQAQMSGPAGLKPLKTA
jgi:Transcription initiation factor IID, 31kD subunit